MNSKILETLEFGKIKQKIQGYLVTDQGQRLLNQLLPLNNPESIDQRLNETAEGVELHRLNKTIPVARMENINPYLKRLNIDADLNGQEIYAIGHSLRIGDDLIDFFEKCQNEDLDLEESYALAEQIASLPSLSRRIVRSLSADGYVHDEASSDLKDIRQQIKKTEKQIRDRLNEMISGSLSKYLTDNVVTIRNNRFVLPVKAENRNSFGGVVHDQSQTGQTLFIEPQAILDLNNRLNQYHSEESVEIRRILSELSQEIAPYTAEIENNHRLIGIFDLIRAKAAYAAAIKASRPNLSVNQHVNLRQAWHPLLEQDQAVANDIYFGDDIRTLLITGPNTGGKTITLKTVGLIQLMGQSGLFIPADQGSQIGIFREIFADIGDEQSIEQNLSTFSSHMTNIISILNQLTSEDLVLVDELGSGTDPQEGAALAISILDYMAAINPCIMATTHYPELKAYGYDRIDTINASMEFNNQTLEPTYRLLIGIPGRSNAFDIAERLGMPQAVIQQSRGQIDEDSQDLNRIISDLESKRRDVEFKDRETQENLKASEDLLKQVKEGYQELKTQRDHQIDQAKKEANRIIHEATQKSDKIIKDLRRIQRDSQAGVKDHELINKQGEMSKLRYEEEVLKKNKVLQRENKRQTFQVGDEVKVNDYGQRGSLVEKRGDAWVVQMGILKMEIPEDGLTKLEEELVKEKIQATSFKSSGANKVKPELDLRGQRYEDAERMLRDYLDQALLSSYPQVTIIHGHGTGVIREMVQKALKKHPQVKSFNYAHHNQGGTGATEVQFKG